MGRGRRPTDEVRNDVLAAAGTVLLERGMGGFNIDAVAKHSGASKVTIYKMWPSAGVLALEGYFAALEESLEFSRTGNVEVDLRSQLRAFVDLLTRTPAGKVVAELIGRAQTDEHLRAAFLQRYSGPRRALAVERLVLAKADGQLREDANAEAIVDQLWGACYHRLLIPNQPLDDAFVDSLLDNLFHGVGP